VTLFVAVILSHQSGATETKCKRQKCSFHRSFHRSVRTTNVRIEVSSKLVQVSSVLFGMLQVERGAFYWHSRNVENQWSIEISTAESRIRMTARLGMLKLHVHQAIWPKGNRLLPQVSSSWWQREYVWPQPVEVNFSTVARYS